MEQVYNDWLNSPVHKPATEIVQRRAGNRVEFQKNCFRNGLENRTALRSTQISKSGVMFMLGKKIIESKKHTQQHSYLIFGTVEFSAIATNGCGYEAFLFTELKH